MRPDPNNASTNASRPSGTPATGAFAYAGRFRQAGRTAWGDRGNRIRAGRPTLDPRTKLFLLLAANLMLFFHVALTTQIVMVVLFLIPLAAAGRWKTTLNFAITYAVFTALGLLDPDALGLP